ncbi:haloacid dehalogenase-like hydrolase [Trypanosoma brucei equiperdum]|uniref:Haloacid dehalogenase-like hydrolase n=1 Tax=Trypanosoma brucei equiperdum TaxID=630700 RepID=A0A3L6KSJ7_9TRYP|nr:haloacid dehalogenase-like hydrolase [Trypanosoma brucei equiperdum]
MSLVSVTNRMTYRAAVVDLDGTLLNENHRISAYTLDTIQKLLKRNIPVVIATGRPHPDVFHTIKSCGLQGTYVITSNGARVSDPQLNVIASFNLSEDVVSELIGLRSSGEDIQDPKEVPYTVNLFQHDEWVTDAAREELLQMFASSGFHYRVVDDLQAHQKDGVHELVFLAQPNTLHLLEGVVKKRFEGRISVMRSTSITLDVVHHNANKATAMAKVAELLGLELKDIVSFGDGMNDVQMLAAAGKGYIMGNAQQRLKDALPHLEVIGTNAEDSVAKKLRELFNIED